MSRPTFEPGTFRKASQKPSCCILSFVTSFFVFFIPYLAIFFFFITLSPVYSQNSQDSDKAKVFSVSTRDVAVGIATRLRGEWCGVRIPVGIKYFISIKWPNHLWDPPTFVVGGYWGQDQETKNRCCQIFIRKYDNSKLESVTCRLISVSPMFIKHFQKQG